MISIIIPNYNGEKTIGKCLEHIFSSNYKKYEIIIVDDASTDNSVELIKNHSCKLIQLKTNKGAANARNVGARIAKGDTLLFLDNDVLINKNTLSIIKKSFDDDISVVVGMPSKKSLYKNISTIYKILNKHYFYSMMPKFIPIICTLIVAIKRELFITYKGFDTNYRTASNEDNDLGYRISDDNHKIFLNKKLQVMHHKYFSFLGILKNDLKRGMSWVKLFLRRREFKKVISEKRYLSAPISYMASVPTAFFILFSLFILPFHNLALWLSLFFFGTFLILNKGFLKFLMKEKGLVFFLISIAITFFDMLSVGIGIVIGTINYLRGDKFD